MTPIAAFLTVICLLEAGSKAEKQDWAGFIAWVLVGVFGMSVVSLPTLIIF